MTSGCVRFLVWGILGLLVGCGGPSNDDRPALHVAAGQNDLVFIRQWIKDGKDVDYMYNDDRLLFHGSGGRVRKQTALMIAAERHNFEVVQLLVNAGANVYLASSHADGYGEGKTVFDYAVEGGDVRIISYLWKLSDKQTMLRGLSRNFLRAFDRGCHGFPQEGKRELVAFFLEAFDRKYATEALWRISEREACIPEIRFIIDQGISPDSKALATAASAGLTAIVSLYLNNAADVNAYGFSTFADFGSIVTPLIAAAGDKKVEAMRLLLSAGANPNLQDSAGRTALIAIVSQSACFRIAPQCEDQLEGIKLLLDHGARVDVKDRREKTAIDYIDQSPADPYAERKRALILGHGQ